ncbi:hypothetical protein [Peribacillus sp. SCS-155]
MTKIKRNDCAAGIKESPVSLIDNQEESIKDGSFDYLEEVF